MKKEVETRLKILRCLNMKPNYSELSREYGVSRQTISKYDKGFKKRESKARGSRLDKYREEIREKVNLIGATITGVYKYFLSKDPEIGSRSNFDYYVRKHKLLEKKSICCHPRYETEPGHQLQVDFKEDIVMKSIKGEEFKFNIFTTTLGYSRMHKFTYSKSKTREDVIRCLIESFEYYGGVPKEVLTDNMSSIVDVKSGKINEEFRQFSKDFNFKVRRCRVRSPETKGKVESANRFLKRLIPYNNEFKDESELKEIIDKITIEVNNEINQTTLLRPIVAFEQERKSLSPLPNAKIIESYLNYMKALKVSKDSLIYYKGKRYSVPPKYINKTVKVKELEGMLHIYVNKALISIHKLSSNQQINYKESDYVEMLKSKLNEKEEIEEIALKNLELLQNLKV